MTIILSVSKLPGLECPARRRKTAQGLVRRVRIVLTATDGLENKALAKQLSAERTRSASGVEGMPSVGSIASKRNLALGLRAQSTISESLRSSAAPWKRPRIQRTGACVRWPGPQDKPRRPSTGSGAPSNCNRIAARHSSYWRTRCSWRRCATFSGYI